MLRWRNATVTRIRKKWNGCVEVDVSIDKRSDDDQDTAKALAYTAIVGEPMAGDRVIVNANALAKKLGTGGYALIIAIPDRLPPDTVTNGHIVKGRYMPQQAMLLAVDEDDSTHREAMMAFESLQDMPTVVADLHSALPAIVAGIHCDAPDARIVYVMTDGGALPAWFSMTLDGLAERLSGTVTVGQAFGGTWEATNIHTGLIAARQVGGADIAIVTQGPGNLGTGTPWGFSGTSCGDAINAITALGGRPVGALRLSDADARDRHYGVSHHSVTAYGRIALVPADLPIPMGLDPEFATIVARQLQPLSSQHRLIEVNTDGLVDALRQSPVRLSTMGRGIDADLANFLACAAAGRHAASLLTD